MARDEALLASVRDGGPPVLRLYGWNPPCVSLGYFQPVSDLDLAMLAALGVGWVRRPTGGRAVLHVNELTYAVAARVDDPRVGGTLAESYRRIAVALAAGLRTLGVSITVAGRRDRDRLRAPSPESVGAPLVCALAGPEPDHDATGSDRARRARELARTAACYSAPAQFELVAGGTDLVSARKLVGSAQVRRGEVFLQHGSVPLASSPLTLSRLLRGERKAPERRTVLASLAGRTISWSEAAQAVRTGFEAALGVAFTPSVYSAAELREAEALLRDRYANEVWLAKRA